MRSELDPWQVDYYFQCLKRRNFRDLNDAEKEIIIEKPLKLRLKTSKFSVIKPDHAYFKY